MGEAAGRRRKGCRQKGTPANLRIVLSYPPPLPGQAVIETTHWPAAEIERRFQEVWRRPVSADTTGSSVQFSRTALEPSSNTIPTINTAINTLAPGCDQRPHRHNGVAATLLHSHHSRGAQRMHSFVIQDEGLHHYTRTPGFSFD